MNKREKSICASILFLLVFVSSFFLCTKKEEATPDYLTEQYLHKSGVIYTYPIGEKTVLSESLGLYMDYLLQTNQSTAYDTMHDSLLRTYMREDGFIYWKRDEQTKPLSNSNSLVDDLRLIRSLYEASERFQNPHYQQTAQRIQSFILTHQVYKGYLTDFYDAQATAESTNIHLFYLDVDALTFFPKTYQQKAATLLMHAPSTPFFPEVYNIETGEYHVNDTVHMVEQALIAYNLVKLKQTPIAFLTFIENQWTNEQMVYGQYHPATTEPIVSYDSPAVYSILILLYEELDNQVMTKAFTQKLQHMQQKNGSYSAIKEAEHFFDHIYPLLAQTKRH